MMKPAIVKFKPGALYRAVAKDVPPYAFAFAFSPINEKEWLFIECNELVFMALREQPANYYGTGNSGSFQVECLLGEHHGLLEYFSASNPAGITVELLQERELEGSS